MDIWITLTTSIVDTVSTILAQNPLSAYISAACVAILGCLLLMGVQRIVTRKMHQWIERKGRFGTVDKRLVLASTRSCISLLYLMPLWWAYSLLSFPKAMHSTANTLFFFLFTVFFVRFLANAVIFLLDTSLRQKETEGQHHRTGALIPIIRTLIWALGFTFLLDNLGFKISSIIAGLGIMGVAVGLAGQAILADFFSYLVILLDQPFTIGDMVTVGTSTGRVVRIGIKTTKIQLPSGEIMVCPNGELTRTRLNNQQPMNQRTRTFTFGIAYETPIEKVKAIAPLIENIAQRLPYPLQIVRTCFTAFGESSLQFEVVYTVPGLETGPLMLAQHDLNIALMEEFAKEEIAFAYPTRTIHMVPAHAADPATPPIQRVSE